jgi:hypothetical protein
VGMRTAVLDQPFRRLSIEAGRIAGLVWYWRRPPSCVRSICKTFCIVSVRMEARAFPAPIRHPLLLPTQKVICTAPLRMAALMARVLYLN